MVGFHTANEEPIYAFHIGSKFYFKQYFDEEEIFGRLRQYYDSSNYRFVVAEGKFDIIYGYLKEQGYELTPVDNLDPFLVVVKKYTNHPDVIFRESVIHGGKGDYNFFLMKDRTAVEQVVKSGATEFTEVDLEHPFTGDS